MTIAFSRQGKSDIVIYYPRYEFGAVAYWSAVINPKIIRVEVLK